MESHFYVYIIFRSDGTPCYVGKGKNDRCNDHLKKSHNRHLARIIAKDSVSIVKIQENLSEEDAFDLEMHLISSIGRVAYGGPLVNMTDGGEGVRSGKQSAEQIEKLRQTRIGRRHTEASKEKCRIAAKSYIHTPEHNAAVSAAKKGKPGKPQSAETKEKRGMALRGRKRPEVAEKLRIFHATASDEKKALKSARISAALIARRKLNGANA